MQFPCLVLLLGLDDALVEGGHTGNGSVGEVTAVTAGDLLDGLDTLAGSLLQQGGGELVLLGGLDHQLRFVEGNSRIESTG